MSGLSEARVALAPAPTQAPAVGQVAYRLILRLSTDNPFYVISALLVLVGLWSSFGAQVRNEQTWALMIGLGGYTLLLAVPACLLVRFGGVWEDVRTVLLVVVLMFLATSVTFDEPLTRDPEFGAGCSLLGLVFASLVSEVVLRIMRLNLPTGFRVPYHLALALFFLYPVGLLPVLDRPRSPELEWGLYLFSPLAGVIALTLLPAVRRGPGYLRDNGSPWPWPWYPWALFVFLGFAVLARSFLLCWSMQHVERSVPERLIFGPYFFAPFLLAVGVVVLEAGLTVGSRGVSRAGLALPAVAALLSAVGHRGDDLYQEFFHEFTTRLGATPLFLALAAAAAFYAVAALRRVPGAGGMLVGTVLAATVVGPETADLNHLAAPRPEPLVLAALLVFSSGLLGRSAGRCLAAVGLAAAAVLAGPWSQAVREGAAFHVVVVGMLAVGAAFDGGLARSLRTLGAALALAASVAVTLGWVEVPGSAARLAREYAPIVALVLAAYGTALRHRPSQAAAGLAVAVWLLAAGGGLYLELRRTVHGLDAIVAGLVLLVVAELISLAKAGLLPRRFARASKSPPAVD